MILMRKVHWFSTFFFMTALCAAFIFTHASLIREVDNRKMATMKKMVAKLGLSDLCLFTDARYTRHPVMADLNTPFQDHPMSMEHFPSGSLVTIPPHLNRRTGDR